MGSINNSEFITETTTEDFNTGELDKVIGNNNSLELQKGPDFNGIEGEIEPEGGSNTVTLLGWEFTVNEEMIVTALRSGYSEKIYGSKNSTVQHVTLWDAETQEILAEADVTANYNSFGETEISPIQLQTNNNYILSTTTNGYHRARINNNVILNDRLTWVSGKYSYSDSFPTDSILYCDYIPDIKAEGGYPQNGERLVNYELNNVENSKLKISWNEDKPENTDIKIKYSLESEFHPHFTIENGEEIDLSYNPSNIYIHQELSTEDISKTPKLLDITYELIDYIELIDVNLDITTNYNIKNNLNKDINLNYNIKNYLDKNSILNYNIKNYLDKNTNLNYNIKNNLDVNSILNYNIKNNLNKDINLNYNINNNLNVNSILNYNIKNYLDKNTNLNYNIKNNLERLVNAGYNVNNEKIVHIDTNLNYNIKNYLDKNINLNYNIKNNLDVNSILNYSIKNNLERLVNAGYNVNNEKMIYIDTNLNYNIKNNLDVNSILNYNIKNNLDVNSVLNYAIKNVIYEDIMINYRINKLVELLTKVDYNVISDIIDVLLELNDIPLSFKTNQLDLNYELKNAGFDFIIKDD